MTILRLFSLGGPVLAALSVVACGGGSAMTTTTTGSASSGAGGGGGGAGGGGTGGTFVPGPHQPLPQVVDQGGTVLKTPKVQLIRYKSDPHAVNLDGFLQELTKTAFWADTTSEYGVGALKVLPTIIRPEAAPASVMDGDLQADLANNTSGGNPLWGAADPETIYISVMPPGTVINANGNCCVDFDGYHDETMSGATTIAYGVVCSCGGKFDGPGVTDVQQITIAMSHELVEAATDPHPFSGVAFSNADPTDAAWTLASGGELADMCEFNLNSFWVPTGSKYMIQTSWSNAAAKAGKDPCVPSPQKGPYFGATPVPPDALGLDIQGVPTKAKGVKLAVGGKKTIPVQLYSDGPLTGPFTVKAMDGSALLGGPANLKLTLDKSSGSNGDTLMLTIEVVAIDANVGADVFVLLSTQGADSSLSFGVVAN